MFLVYVFVFFLYLQHVAKCIEDNSTDVEESYEFLLTHGFSITWRSKIVRTYISLRPQMPEEFFGDNHYCGGVVISEQHVLTAAACVMDSRHNVYRVRNLIAVGGWPKRLLYSFDMTRIMRTARIIVHPLYITSSTDNIAIIKLRRPILFKNAAINIAKLPKEPVDFSTAVNCRLIGLGRRYKRGPLAGEVKVIDLQIPINNSCPFVNKAFRRGDEICAVDAKYNMMAPCQGDLGSPLFCNNILYGIASATEHCQDKNPVSRFTDVYVHMDFIEETIKNEVSRNENFLLLILIGIISFII